MAVQFLLLAACVGPIATPTPQRTLTGPTVEPSPTFARPQIEAPLDSFIGISDPTAAALPPDGALPPLAVAGIPQAGERQVVEITAEDGTLLVGYLYLSEAVRLPGVLLIAPDREAWGDFPAKVYNNGFTVLVLGLRDTSRLADFRAALLSLSSGLADPASLAVIGAGAGADVALLGCAGELLCDTTLLLSPSNDPALLDAMVSFNPRPLLLAASQNDALSFGAVQALQATATGENLLQPFTDAGHGADMLLNRPDLGDLIIQWLERHIG